MALKQLAQPKPLVKHFVYDTMKKMNKIPVLALLITCYLLFVTSVLATPSEWDIKKTGPNLEFNWNSTSSPLYVYPTYVQIAAENANEGGQLGLAGTGINPYFYLDVLNDRFRIHAGGTEKMTVKSNGNVGIGTTSPGSLLHVGAGSATLAITPTAQIAASSGDSTLAITAANSAGNDAQLWLENIGQQNWTIQASRTLNALDISRNNASVSLMTILAGGNVGIGTTSPNYKLDLRGPAALGGNYANLDPNSGISLSPLANSCLLLIGWNRSAGGGETDFISNRCAGNVGGFKFYDYTNTGTVTELMTLKGDGNVIAPTNTHDSCSWEIGGYGGSASCAGVDRPPSKRCPSGKYAAETKYTATDFGGGDWRCRQEVYCCGL